MKTFKFCKEIEFFGVTRNNDELRVVTTKGKITIFQDSFDRYHFLFFNKKDESEWLNNYSDSAIKYYILEDLIIFTDRDGDSRLINSKNGQWIVIGENCNYKFRTLNLTYCQDSNVYTFVGKIKSQEGGYNQKTFSFNLNEIEEKSALPFPLKSNYPEGIDLEAKGEFLKEEMFEKIKTFAYKVLDPEVAKEVLADITYKQGSNTKFVILVNMYLESIHDPRRVLTTKQLFNNLDLLHGKYYADCGLYLTGNEINPKEANHLIKQFQEKEIAKLNENRLINPIWLELRNLSLTKEGLIELTKNAIWYELECPFLNDYSFSELNKFGIPKKGTGKTNYITKKSGLFARHLDGHLDFVSGFENFILTKSDGRVVLELA